MISSLPIPTRFHRPCRFPQIEDEVIAWAKEMTLQGKSLTDLGIKERALSTAEQFQIPLSQFKASHGWLERFKVRAGIAAGRIKLEEEEPISPAPSSTFPSTSSDSASLFSVLPEDQDTEMSSSTSSIAQPRYSLTPQSTASSFLFKPCKHKCTSVSSVFEYYR